MLHKAFVSHVNSTIQTALKIAAEALPNSPADTIARERLLGTQDILNPFVDWFESTLSQVTASIEYKKKHQQQTESQ